MSELIPFDDSALTEDTKGKLNCCEREIKKASESHKKSGLEMGRALSVARSLLGSEVAFGSWVEARFPYSRRTAYRYISVYTKFDGCANLAQYEDSALYELATNDRAKIKADKLAAKGMFITHAKAKELTAEDKPKPPRIEAPKVEDAEFTVVETESEAVSESGEDASTEAQGKKPQETAPRPTRNVKEKPGDVPCANCTNRRWTEGVTHWVCTKCGHFYGECVGDRDDDEVVDERITTKKAKARKTIEAAMREFDDLQVLVPNPKEHADAILTCKLLLNKLKNWN